jgi:hypothetical protein
VIDQRGRLLRAALGFAGLPRPSYDRAPWALRIWLDSWAGIERIAVGMARQGFDLQLTRYDDRGWRATFYTTEMEHAHERDRHRLGAHSVAGDAAGGVGGVGESQPGWLEPETSMDARERLPLLICLYVTLPGRIIITCDRSKVQGWSRDA